MPSDQKSMYIFLLKCKLSQMQNATGLRYSAHTVNLEHFARVLFSRISDANRTGTMS